MDLRPGDRAPELPPGALPWSPQPAEPHPHHTGSLHGATATGEAARPRLAVRIGLWLGDGGVVHKARWRAVDDAGLRAAAEAACALLAFVTTSFLELAAGLIPIPAELPLLTFAAGVLMLAGMAVFAMRSMRRARSALVLERHAIEAELVSLAREAPAVGP